MAKMAGKRNRLGVPERHTHAGARAGERAAGKRSMAGERQGDGRVGDSQAGGMDHGATLSRCASPNSGSRMKP